MDLYVFDTGMAGFGTGGRHLLTMIRFFGVGKDGFHSRENHHSTVGVFIILDGGHLGILILKHFELVFFVCCEGIVGIHG